MRWFPSSHFCYLLFYKPYGALAQFSSPDGRPTLKDFVTVPNVYPVGRLDVDSEGLLLLTDDGVLAHFLIDPRYGHARTYLVQVERVPSEEDLEKLRKGIIIQGKRTRSAEVVLLNEAPSLPPRSTPIRFRKSVPTAWLRFVLREGRNRQVRKMTAGVGYPTLRLVRIGIGPLRMRGLNPGEKRELTKGEKQALVNMVGNRRSVPQSPQ